MTNMLTNESTTEEIAEGLKEFAKWAKEYGYCISLEPSVEIITCKNGKHCYHITDAPKVLVCEKHNCQ